MNFHLITSVHRRKGTERCKHQQQHCMSTHQQEQGHSTHDPVFKPALFRDQTETSTGHRPPFSHLSSPVFLWGQVELSSVPDDALQALVLLLSFCTRESSTSDFRALCPNFSSLGLLQYFVYRATAVTIVPKLFFLFNCRDFESE